MVIQWSTIPLFYGRKDTYHPELQYHTLAILWIRPRPVYDHCTRHTRNIYNFGSRHDNEHTLKILFLPVLISSDLGQHWFQHESYECLLVNPSELVVDVYLKSSHCCDALIFSPFILCHVGQGKKKTRLPNKFQICPMLRKTVQYIRRHLTIN